jgi:hypothetical protein
MARQNLQEADSAIRHHAKKRGYRVSRESLAYTGSLYYELFRKDGRFWSRLGVRLADHDQMGRAMYDFVPAINIVLRDGDNPGAAIARAIREIDEAAKEFDALMAERSK